jgi:hypothetical protein
MLAGSLGCAWVQRFAASRCTATRSSAETHANPRCLSTLPFHLGQLITRISDMRTSLVVTRYTPGGDSQLAYLAASSTEYPRIGDAASRRAGHDGNQDRLEQPQEPAMTCGTRFGCSFGRATDWQRVVQWASRPAVETRRRPSSEATPVVGGSRLVEPRGNFRTEPPPGLDAPMYELNASRVKTPHSHRHHPSDAGISPKGSHRRIEGFVKTD